MPARKIIIDTDPGQDDAGAIMLAAASPELDVLALTAVAGNVPLELTKRNARLILDICGRSDIPVYAGAEKPLERDLVTAEKVHGKTGIDGIDIYEPPITAREEVRRPAALYFHAGGFNSLGRELCGGTLAWLAAHGVVGTRHWGKTCAGAPDCPHV